MALQRYINRAISSTVKRKAARVSPCRRSVCCPVRRRGEGIPSLKWSPSLHINIRIRQFIQCPVLYSTWVHEQLSPTGNQSPINPRAARAKRDKTSMDRSACPVQYSSPTHSRILFPKFRRLISSPMDFFPLLPMDLTVEGYQELIHHQPFSFRQEHHAARCQRSLLVQPRSFPTTPAHSGQ